MEQYKFSLFYWELYLLKSEKMNRRVRIYIAALSVISAAVWLELDQFKLLWAALITLAQFLNAIYEYLPYGKRTNELGNLIIALTPVYYGMEKDWFKVANGSVTETEIHNSLYSHADKWTKKDLEHFKDTSLPQDKKLIGKADILTNEYFKNMFGE